MPEPTNVTYFRTPAELRTWFRAHHATADELWVGFYRKGSGTRGVTWAESVDQALCVGWIDGIRKRIDDQRYTNRFTPRRKSSTWSTVNIGRVKALTSEKRMRPAGLTAYGARLENKSGIYAYEQRRAELEQPYASLLKKNTAAWTFFEAQPPSYRRVISWWIISAKKPDTRMARLEKLVDASARGRRL